MSLSDCIIDTCDHGHKFAKLDDHPGNSCVHCLRLGLASARAERDALAAHVVELRDALEDMVIINEEDEANVRLARAALARRQAEGSET